MTRRGFHFCYIRRFLFLLAASIVSRLWLAKCCKIQQLAYLYSTTIIYVQQDTFIFNILYLYSTMRIFLQLQLKLFSFNKNICSISIQTFLFNKNNGLPSTFFYIVHTSKLLKVPGHSKYLIQQNSPPRPPLSTLLCLPSPPITLFHE